MICAIVLAAGRSERMGTQKLLLPLAGKPVIVRVVDQLSHGQVHEILVVIGRDGAAVRRVFVAKPIRFVENSDPGSDMLGSLRCGLRVLPSNCEATLVVLGDQPGMTQVLVDELIRRFRGSESKIVVPTCNGHRGHPVLFSSQYVDEVLTSHASVGLRGFLDRHAKEVTYVAVSDSTTMEDMDVPADYQRQEKRFANRYADTVSPP